MKTNEYVKPKTIYLKDYQPYPLKVKHTYLKFNIISQNSVKVDCALSVEKVEKSDGYLFNGGSELKLIEVYGDGTLLVEGQYKFLGTDLWIADDAFKTDIRITTEIQPDRNTSLSGMYLTRGNIICTQCEAEGFRNITFYPDRPDVLAEFTVEIEADEKVYPYLLSNGNLLEEKALENGRKWIKWSDPHPKPSYLFALVAGDLSLKSEEMETMSGKKILLQVFTEKDQISKVDFSLEALREAIRWDEMVYDFEYDLDRFMIVAVRDFNAGAMENKSLNIFNSKYILSSPETATDLDYENIAAIIGHEYFHNWTGNRVTCRDWFQLSLKEGLTVFREQQFAASIGSEAFNRISDVIKLRTSQFQEDGGPLAHPVRPSSYIEINNFYTRTVYEKGAEVVRMLFNFLGDEGFFQGMRLYIERHDGQAATIEDFLKALGDANALDLDQFMNWYQQAGTPTIEFSDSYDAVKKCYTATLKQSLPRNPNKGGFKPFVIPFAMGLLGKDGNEFALEVDHARLSDDKKTAVLFVTKEEQKFVFHNISEKPTPSLLRGFSSPVYLKHSLSEDDLYFLMEKDTDAFARWEAFQYMYEHTLKSVIAAKEKGIDYEVPTRLTDALKKSLKEGTIDKRVLTLAVAVPDEMEVLQWLQPFDIEIIYEARLDLLKTIAKRLKGVLLETFQRNQTLFDYSRTKEEVDKRALRNTVLELLMYTGDSDVMQICLHYYQQSDNMTDKDAVLRALLVSDSIEKERIFDDFYKQWKDDPLVLDAWFFYKAKSSKSIKDIEFLINHEKFERHNPNRIFSVVKGVVGNIKILHNRDGSGYQWLSSYVMDLDKSNPQVASRILQPLTNWRQYDKARQELMTACLRDIKNQEPLSKDVFEFVEKSLQ